MALTEDAAGRQELSSFLVQCFEALKVYGKEPEQLMAVNGMFQMVLSDYPIGKIKSAFKAYLKTNSEMPAPADIVHLIERGNRPPLDRAVYVSISRKDGALRTPDEWRYLREFEQFQITGKLS